MVKLGELGIILEIQVRILNELVQFLKAGFR